MSWGTLYFYYECPHCGKLFKYSIDAMYQGDNDFGKCPNCKTMGKFIKDGAVTLDDFLYEEVE